MTNYDPTVTVCSKCLKASCWQGIFMCEGAYDASTVKRKVSALIRLDEEHPDYWNNELNSGNKQLLTPNILELLGAKNEKLELSDNPGTV